MSVTHSVIGPIVLSVIDSDLVDTYIIRRLTISHVQLHSDQSRAVVPPVIDSRLLSVIDSAADYQSYSSVQFSFVQYR